MNDRANERLLARSQKLFLRTLKTVHAESEVRDAIDRVDGRARDQQKRRRKRREG